MNFERIDVSTRDEYVAGQEPTAFEWRGRRYFIDRILDRWYEGRMDSTRMPLRYFRVHTRCGKRYILRYHEFFSAWGILVPEDEAGS